MTSRSWCYTLNNYTEEERDALRRVSCCYQVFGYERGDEGTPHLQGYIHFKSARSQAAVKKEFPRCHLEVRKGTVDQAVEYCKKDGDFEEFGEKPLSQKEKGDTQKRKWREIIDRAHVGDEDWLLETHPSLYYRDLKLFRSHKKANMEVMAYSDSDTPHEWWVGDTGTGKSRKLWEEYPNHYKKGRNKWWDDYHSEPVVAIEEWCPKNDCTASYLKEWVDRYPFRAEVKGGHTTKIRPQKIIVLSNYTIEQCFQEKEDIEPLRRRFKVVRFGAEPAQFDPNYNIYP